MKDQRKRKDRKTKRTLVLFPCSDILRIRKKLWKEAFWSQSFCLLTSGGAPIEVIREYIRTQGEKGNEKRVQIPDLSES